MVEEAELELRPQHPSDRPLERGLVDETTLERVEKRGPIAVRRRQLDIEPCVERHRSGVRAVPCEAVVLGDLADREIVGDDTAFETPLLAEHPGEKVAVGSAEDAVDLVVCAHHRGDAGGAHRRLERVEVHLPELTRKDPCRRPVHPAFRCAITDQVLRGRDHALAEVATLEPAHERHAHLRDQVGVLAEGLLGPSPAWIAADVEHRCKPLMRADGTHLPPDRVAEHVGELRLPCTCQSDRLREDGRLAGHQAGTDLLVDDRRDAEAGLLGQVPLDRIGEEPRVPGAE
jgi:hypothetical protein